MSDVPPPQGSADLPDMSAAEHALGLLDGEDRAVAVRRVLADPAYAQAVERWRGHFAPWFAQWPEIPAPDILSRIERSLDAGGTPAVATLAPKARAARRAPWREIAAFSSVATAALLVVLVTRQPSPTPVPRAAPAAPAALAPTLVAAIVPEDKGAPLTALYDASAGAIRLTAGHLATPGRSAELWVIPADGTPHSLGVMREGSPTTLTLAPANRQRIAAGAVLAVTIEPFGGSPSGRPTGPVVAKGALSPV